MRKRKREINKEYQRVKIGGAEKGEDRNEGRRHEE
jgi:hypothetical protein